MFNITRHTKPNEDLTMQIMQVLYNDPVLFSQVVLNVEPDEQQAEVLRRFYDKQRTSVRSGRGTGKTWVAGMLVWHFLCTRPQAQVFCTAPSGASASGALWPTLKKIYNSMDKYWADQFEFQNSNIKHIVHGLTWFCNIRVARQENPDAMAGGHSEHMLYVVDEASGVSDEILNIISMSLTEEDNRLLLISNPRRLSGGFFDSQQREKRNIYNQLHMSCYKSKYISPKKLKDMIIECGGEGTDQYTIEILGEFPKKEEKCIIDMENINKALDRELEPEEYSDIPVIWGADMAAGNDTSVLVKRQGPKVFDDIKRWKYNDTMKVVDKIVEEFQNTPKELKPYRINVDAVGVGKGAYDRMKEKGLPVYPAIAQKKAISKKYMANQKSEWWKEMREWFKEEVEIPEDKNLVYELSSMHSIVTPDGRFKTEPKTDFIKRFGHSPDTADAMAMTFCLSSKKVIGLIT